jgi:hypothetical protein
VQLERRVTLRTRIDGRKGEAETDELARVEEGGDDVGAGDATGHGEYLGHGGDGRGEAL